MTSRIWCAALAAFTLTPAPATATMPGENGRIVVQRETGKQFDLYTINADGTGERAVRRTPKTIETEPSWSPDGSRLAFASGPADSLESELFTTDAGGGDLQRITRFGSAVNSVSWAPSGDKLVFFTLKDFADFDGIPPAELYTIGTDGKDARRLTDDLQIQTDPFYSPDGKRLVYAQWRAVKGQEGVFDIALKFARADGSHPRSLTSISAKRDTFNASWSPDGKYLAFEIAGSRPLGRDGGRQSDLAVIGVNGKGEHRLTSTRSIETNPVWSPDGTQIAFTSDRHATGGSGKQNNKQLELYVMDADGTNIRRLTHNKVADTHPDWQPLP